MEEKPSPARAAIEAISTLCDVIGEHELTPMRVADAIADEVEAIGVAEDAKVASGWLSALEFLAARRASP